MTHKPGELERNDFAVGNMDKLEGLSIGPFRGDYEGLERMAHASWRDEYGQASFPNFYRPAFLHYLFDRIPEDRRDLLSGAHKNGEIVAFLANLPEKFHFEGKIYNAVYSCLLVVRKEYLRQGLALDLIRAAVALNGKKYGFDFSLLTLETGHRSTLMMNKLIAEGNRIESVRKSGVMARILDLDRVDASEGLKGYEKAAIRLFGAHRPPKEAPHVDLREYRPADLDACHALLDRYKDSVRLALAWDKRDLAVELPQPYPQRGLHRHGRFRQTRLAGRAVLSEPLHPLPEGGQSGFLDVQPGNLARRDPLHLRDPGLMPRIQELPFV